MGPRWEQDNKINIVVKGKAERKRDLENMSKIVLKRNQKRRERRKWEIESWRKKKEEKQARTIV